MNIFNKMPSLTTVSLNKPSSHSGNVRMYACVYVCVHEGYINSNNVYVDQSSPAT
eukprot:m.65754 g.65754  ORF g.65754 m.65754 type:complete len:55 (+) comp11538_c2_seq1:126-290(+)